MATTQEDIRDWLKEGKRRRSTHVIVVCDTFDHSDYPVYVKRTEKVREEADKHDGPNMQRVMEVYALHLDLELQLAEKRSFHYEDPPGKSPPPLRLVPPPNAPTPPAQPVADPTAWVHSGTGHYERRDGMGRVNQINSHKWSASAQVHPVMRGSEHVGYARTACEAMRLVDAAAVKPRVLSPEEVTSANIQDDVGRLGAEMEES